jgi:hypothetical protein
MTLRRLALLILLCGPTVLSACGDDTQPVADAGTPDAAATDGAHPDGGALDLEP